MCVCVYVCVCVCACVCVRAYVVAVLDCIIGEPNNVRDHVYMCVHLKNSYVQAQVLLQRAYMETTIVSFND